MSTNMPVTSHERPGIPLRQVIAAALFLCLIPLVLIGFSGRLDWTMGWMYLALMMLGIFASRYFAWRNDPDLLAERVRSADTVTGPERILMPLVGMIGPIAVWIVAGLDQRYGWSAPVTPWLAITALILGAAGNAIVTWAMAENSFFSSVVRIQKDRNQSMCTTGPYRFVRHPGYAGAALFYVTSPLALSALWAYVPVVVLVVALVVRITLEERMLKQELNGYTDYTRKVHYRLLPGVW